MRQGSWELFRILGVETRLRILEILAERGPIGTGAIAGELGVTPAAVSQHLAVMRRAGLVTKERRGYRVPYSVDQNGLDLCCGHLVELCSCGCGHRGRRRRGPLRQSTVEALRRRERELVKETEAVRERIRSLSRGARPGRVEKGGSERTERPAVRGRARVVTRGRRRK